MAVAPLFVVDIDTLKQDIRISGTTSVDTLSVLDRVVQEVRRNIYKRLGATTIAEILAITYNENPTTDDEYKRLDANLLETLWVQYLMYSELPVLVFDASVSTPPMQVWNEEPLTRDAAQEDELKKTMDSLLERINDLLDRFTEKTEGIHVTTFSPEVTRVQNDSVFEGGLTI